MATGASVSLRRRASSRRSRWPLTTSPGPSARCWRLCPRRCAVCPSARWSSTTAAATKRRGAREAGALVGDAPSQPRPGRRAAHRVRPRHATRGHGRGDDGRRRPARPGRPARAGRTGRRRGGGLRTGVAVPRPVRRRRRRPRPRDPRLHPADQVVTRTSITDCTNGYRAIDGTALARLRLVEDRFSAAGDSHPGGRPWAEAYARCPCTSAAVRPGLSKKPRSLGYASGYLGAILRSWARARDAQTGSGDRHERGRRLLLVFVLPGLAGGMLLSGRSEASSG